MGFLPFGWKKKGHIVGVCGMELNSKGTLHHSSPAVSSPQIKRLITMSRHEGHYIPAAGDLMRPPAARFIQERPCGQGLQSAGALFIYLFIYLPSSPQINTSTSQKPSALYKD